MATSNLEKIEYIARKARKSISKFCYEECKSYCCRKGYLILNSSNVDLVAGEKRRKLEEKKLLLKISDSNYSLNLGKDSNCPSLKDYKCIIHRNPKRPLACKNFPLFIEGNKIKLSPRCLAVKQGLFYPFVSKLLKLGYRLSETNPFSEFDTEICLN